jgi:cytidylate kinase
MGDHTPKLIVLLGPNGVGKSSVSQALFERLTPSARVESEWCRMTHPFAWSEEIVALTIHNLSHLLRGYLTCPTLEDVILSYGLHGPRRRIWEAVLGNLADLAFAYRPIILTCDEEEHVARLVRDGRDAERIRRALATRPLYDDLPYPRIDTTGLTVDEVAGRVLALMRDQS